MSRGGRLYPEEASFAAGVCATADVATQVNNAAMQRDI
jgi:hypothetical protein